MCERGDSNPHGTGPRDPKSRASTNSATFARTKDKPVVQGVEARADERKGREAVGPTPPSDRVAEYSTASGR